MEIKKLIKFNFKALFFVFLTSLISCQSAPESSTDDQETKFKTPLLTAHSSWIEEHFQTEIVKIGLEQLGYQVAAPKEIEYPPIYISLANGDLDYSVVYYEPGHELFFNNAGGTEKLTGVGNLTPNGVQGYQIDKKTAAQYNITNIEQLKDPKIAKLFDSDNDGKANLVGCNAGWSCELVIEHHLEAYGLTDTIEHDRGQYTALLANSMTRYKQGEAIIFYAYNPHWISAVLKPEQDVVWLEVPFTSLPKGMEKITAEKTSVNGKNYGFPKVEQRIVANKKFLAANLIARRWFELVKIPAEDINIESLRIQEGENRPEDIQRHAQEWVAQNQELFESWLKEASNE